MFRIPASARNAAFALAVLSAWAAGAQTVPTTINYQGRLTDNTPSQAPITATVNMQFAIFDAPTAGAALWTEPATGSTPVTVTGGIFSVLLGASAGASSVPIPASVFSTGTARYLQIYANGETLSPRQTISAAGYANQAQSAALAATATTATTATNSTQLGGVAAANYQRILSPASCAAGQFLSGVTPSGVATCGSAQSSLTPPVNLSGSLSPPILTASNGGSGDGLLGTSSLGFGIRGLTSDTTKTGILGYTGPAFYYYTNSGVSGYSDAGEGVAGITTGGTGVVGTVVSPGGGKAGAFMITDATNNNTALYASTSGGGAAIAAYGNGGTALYGSSASGWGVDGEAPALTGPVYGVVGQTQSNGGVGVYGAARSPSALTGTVTIGVQGVNLATSGTGYGVYGSNSSSLGAGVYGASSGTGVYGQGTVGVSGASNTLNGTAVQGIANNGANAWGVYGGSTSGKAGYFNGNVQVAGTLSKTAGSFKIDHPLDPENKYLYHSFVESPDMKNIYDGMALLDNRGEAVVELPEWFDALNRDFRYQLTAVGAPGPNLHIAKKLAGNRFTIAGGNPGMEVSWMITGIRRDPYAERYRIPVEQEKPTEERGSYLHPEVYGQPAEKGVEWATHPEMMKRMKEERKNPAPAAIPPAAPAATPPPPPSGIRRGS